jgi:branched-chain amino acid transport system substrate-binding protein
MITRRFLLQSAAAAAAYSAQGFPAARAENAPGVTDTEIKIGQTMPYSGPASAYGVIGRTEAAYFKMINEQSGVNGRKINFVSLDDAYTPSNTVEQTRRLIEEERVAFIFGSLGGYTNLAVRNISTTTKSRSCSFRSRPTSLATPSIIPGRSAPIPRSRAKSTSTRNTF